MISVSIQDIQQNPQDTSNFYLANIYQLLAEPNQSNISISLPTSPPPFSPPTFAIWVNLLWFLSLTISITCALLATLLQQWARRYLKVTQTRSTLHKRARIRSFFAEGVKKGLLPLAVEALPTLIHVSLVLFFAGLVVFLWNINLTIFKVVMSWISICTALYGCITLVPIFRHDSPYYSPLTSLARPVVFVIVFAFRFLYHCFYTFFFCLSLCFPCQRLMRIFGHISVWLIEVLDIIGMTPEAAALKSSSEIDTRALMWTFDSLDEDHELDRFFSGMPGFHNSRVLKQPLHDLDDQQKLRLLEAMIRLLDRTFSSNLLSDQVKRRRADICSNAIELVDTPKSFSKLVRRLVSEDVYGPVQSTEIVDFVRRWGNRKLDGNRQYSALVQAIFSIVVARVQRHDDSWFILASNELGIPETVLREYAGHGDNLSFAILIYVTRQQFIHIRNPSWPSTAISEVLRAASKHFNAEDTSPELQHEFCALWNEIVRDGQKDTSKIPEHLLRPIRNTYIALHRGTNSAPTRFSSTTGHDDAILWVDDAYPVCNVSGHISGRIHNHSDSNALAHIVPHDHPTLSPSLLVTPVAPSFTLPELFHADETLPTVPPHDNSYPTRQTIENLRFPVTSPDPASAATMRDPASKKLKSHRQKRDIVTTSPQPAPEPSATSYPPSAPAPPVTVPLRPHTIPQTSRVPRTLPAPAPSVPALDNTLHSGLSLSFPLPRRHLTAPSHRLIIVTTHYPPSANRTMRTIIPTTLDPQAPPPLVADSDEANPCSSVRELDNGQTGGPSSFTSPV